MSEATKRALDDAIAAHVADEAEAPDTIVTGYALVASHATTDDFDAERTQYLFEYQDRQPFHVGLGLVHRHRLILEQQDD